MGIPYRARVNERWFLNLPGFHGGAYVVAYVEDTTVIPWSPQRGGDGLSLRFSFRGPAGG